MKKIYTLAIGLLAMGLNAQTGNLSKSSVGNLSTSIPANSFSSEFLKNAAGETLSTENFETFTVGNASGQKGYLNYNGTAADYKIENDSAHGNYLTISASGGTAGTAATRFFYETSSAFADAWDGRKAGNDILKGEFDIYTGSSTSTTAGTAGVVIYGETAGVIGITWSAATKSFTGTLALKNKSTGAIGTYNLTFGGVPTFNANTWYKVGYEYDYNTGAGTFIFPNGTSYTWDNTSNTSFTIVPNSVPLELDFVATTNLSTARTYGYDNSTVQATNKASLGAIKVTAGEVSKISIYPNPTTDVLNVTNTKSLESYKIFDASGKLMLEGSRKGTEINVTKLGKGVYTIQFITAENGFETRQFIKK